jgi:hypothetical protein
VRVFAREYAGDVVGVVLIDSMSPSSARRAASDTTAQADDPAVVDWLLTLPARAGVLRLLAGPLQMKAGLSPEVADAYTAVSVTTRALQTGIDESKGMPDSLAEAGAVKSFGELPLIVLSRGVVPGKDEAWQRMQTELLELSSNSQQLFADRSGHIIHLDQPEAAVSAIDQMVEQTRTLGWRR